MFSPFLIELYCVILITNIMITNIPIRLYQILSFKLQQSSHVHKPYELKIDELLIFYHNDFYNSLVSH